MKATYTLKPEELNENFLHTLQDTLKDRGSTLKLTVEPIGKPEGMDTTEWLLSDPETRRIMENGLAAYKAGKSYKTTTMQELEALAQ
jgi:hypothetical protein